MFRYIFSGLLLATAIVGVQLYLQQGSNDNGSAAGTKALPTATSTPRTNSAGPKPTQQNNIAMPLDGRGIDDSDPDFEFSATAADLTEATPVPAWQEPEASPEPPDRYRMRGVDARALTVNDKAFSNIKRGSNIKLPIPQTGNEYEMQVAEVGRHLNGDRTLSGRLVGEDQPYSVTMTKGSSSTFATINTPDGSFLLEASGEQGWIMSLADLDSLIDQNLVDYKIPEITR